MAKDVEINLRSPTTMQDLMRAVDEVGGLPVVVLPLHDGKAMSQGIGCRTGRDIIEALRWAYRTSPESRVRMVPAQLQPTC